MGSSQIALVHIDCNFDLRLHAGNPVARNAPIGSARPFEQRRADHYNQPQFSMAIRRQNFAQVQCSWGLGLIFFDADSNPVSDLSTLPMVGAMVQLGC